MIDFWKLRNELRLLGHADLLKIAAMQTEHNCILNPSGPCQFYFKYKGFGFCVSELSGHGCQPEKAWHLLENDAGGAPAVCLQGVFSAGAKPNTTFLVTKYKI